MCLHIRLVRVEYRCQVGKSRELRLHEQCWRTLLSCYLMKPQVPWMQSQRILFKELWTWHLLVAPQWWLHIVCPAYEMLIQLLWFSLGKLFRLERMIFFCRMKVEFMHRYSTFNNKEITTTAVLTATTIKPLALSSGIYCSFLSLLFVQNPASKWHIAPPAHIFLDESHWSMQSQDIFTVPKGDSIRWLKSSIKLIQDDGLNLQIYFFTILD